MGIRAMSHAEYHSLVQVAQCKQPATTWFRHVRYLNIYTGQIEEGHIVLSGKRIAYTGQKEPLTSEQTEIIELDPEQIMVPGYIEPHAHPSQWYNPLSWGDHLLKQGSTTSLNDNLFLLTSLGVDKALQFIDELDTKGDHLWLWWARFDEQTSENEEASETETGSLTEPLLRRWLAHPLVTQGGELSSWPQLLKGNKKLEKWLNMTRSEFGKRIEGHLPGASSETLGALGAAGVGADHESLNGEDVLKRLRLGMYAALRYSSIRPDLPQILSEIKDQPELNVSRIMLTNDGSSPFFVEQSGCDAMLKMVMDAGFKPIDAYRMATLNPATYYALDQDLGGIAPGRLAHFNILNHLEQPTPVHVMVDGDWVVRNGERVQHISADWLQDYFQPLIETTTFSEDMLIKENGTTGIEFINEVITRPYEYTPGSALDDNETQISLVDPEGNWVINTRGKQFVNNQLVALASTYTLTKHYLLIGRDHSLMVKGLHEALNNGGGVVAYFADGHKWQIRLPLNGRMSMKPMPELADTCKAFLKEMKKHGYPYGDPIFSMLFLTATHLPFIRLTKDGLYDVKKQEVIAPATQLKNMTIPLNQNK